MVSHGKRTSSTRLHARTNQQHPKCELLLQLSPAPTSSNAQVCQTLLIFCIMVLDMKINGVPYSGQNVASWYIINNKK